MKKFSLLISIIALIVLTFSDVISSPNDSYSSSKGGAFSKVGAAGSQFLKIPVGARANGLAGAYTALANDLTSIWWNPAGMANVKGMSIDLNNTQWFADFSHNWGALSMPMGDFVAAVSFTSFGKADIPITTMERPEGTGANYSVSDVSIALSVAGYLTEQFAFGITAKYINNEFSSVNASGLAFDVGSLYHTGIYGINIGFAIFNLGGEQQYEGQDLRTTKNYNDVLWASPLDANYIAYKFSLPIAFRAGISSEIYKDDTYSVLSAIDFVTYSDSPEQFSFGAECTWNDLLIVRAGYLLGNDQFGFGGGIGIKYLTGAFGGKFDYSVNPTANIGLVHRLSVGINLSN